LEVDGELINDGTCFLKAIIDSLHTNTLFSATTTRTALSSLDVYMEKLPKSDISKMNEYVKLKLNELAAANKTTTDLIMNLFKGYAKAMDKRSGPGSKGRKTNKLIVELFMTPTGSP
jgi:hypothetical protein